MTGTHRLGGLPHHRRGLRHDPQRRRRRLRDEAERRRLGARLLDLPRRHGRRPGQRGSPSTPRARLRDGLTALGGLPHHRRGLRHHASTAATDAFVTKLNAAGSALAYSTFLGGAASTDGGLAIAVDATRATPTSAGLTDVSGLPDDRRRLRHDLQRRGDAFVTKLNAAGSALAYSTFLGGSRSTTTRLGDRGRRTRAAPT